MAKMRMPTFEGSGYRKHDRGSNDQFGMHGAIEGRTVSSGGQGPLGPKVARNVGPGGAGVGYDLIGKAGTQGQHGSDAGLTAQIPGGRDILSDYGPES